MDLAPDVYQKRDRPAWRVWLTLLQTAEVEDIDDLARIAGLEPLDRPWTEVDVSRARQFLVAILHKGLGVQERSHDDTPGGVARWRDPSQLSKFNSRFATNSSDMPDKVPFSWTPATTATLDAGIAVIGDGSLPPSCRPTETMDVTIIRCELDTVRLPTRMTKILRDC